MIKHKSDNDDQPEPYDVPDPEWTPKQQENWEEHGKPVYDRLETDVGRYWYRRTWRPKKRNSGMMTREHVKLGTPEDYVKEHVEDTFDPWGSFHGIMMRQLSGYAVDKEELDEAVSDIVRAKLRRIKENDPERAVRLLRETEKVASLYGVGQESANE